MLTTFVNIFFSSVGKQFFMIKQIIIIVINYCYYYLFLCNKRREQISASDVDTVHILNTVLVCNVCVKLERCLSHVCE